MIAFEYPWLFFLLPCPLAVFLFVPGYRSGEASIRIPRLWRIADLTGRQPAEGAVVLQRSWISWCLISLIWLAVVTAVARPQWIGEPVSKIIPSRDLLLAVDLSGSMSTEDFTDDAGKQVNRLTACKQVLDDFLTRRKGDRVGLIFFGTAAFVQAPFTEDLELCRTLLDEAQVGMAGPQTVVGDAVGLALNVFDRSDLDDKVLILLTDGNDTGSKVSPEDAARIGKDKGVTIHTIAVGDPTAVGEEAIDEEVLKSMASTTGGGFYRAADRDELEKIYESLDKLETKDLETQSYQPKTECFYWPLGCALILGLVVHMQQLISLDFFANWRSLFAAAFFSLLLFWLFGFHRPSSGDLTPFHFLRPYWLLCLIPIVGIIQSIRTREEIRRGLQQVIAPHLLKHLVVPPTQEKSVRPIHLLAITWGICIFALAGPTSRREASPFADDQAAIVIAQNVRPTMLAEDIQPSRLTRSVHKIGDLLELRPGCDAALVAYRGSAHLVMPLTTDDQIITAFAGELSPDIMPTVENNGTASALTLSDQVLVQANRVGSIVLITDSLQISEIESIADSLKNPVHILAIAGGQERPLPPNSPPAPAIDEEAIQKAARRLNASLTIVTADQDDVQSLSRRISTSFVMAATQADEDSRWLDMGYWLTPLLALLTLLWFRKGWKIKS